MTATDVRKWIYGMLRPKDRKPLAITTINRRLTHYGVLFMDAKSKKL
ncbi:hypothetical protein [Peribacillus simplex]|nr:hypothetical protein [Peribacillus simplex]WHX93024.1 hypothetical protein QNH50_09360 [Peribacillus simplex]